MALYYYVKTGDWEKKVIKQKDDLKRLLILILILLWVFFVFSLPLTDFAVFDE